jgi:hypothetical protein
MRQQINLYQPVFSSERKLFGASTVASAFAVLVVGLVAYTVNSRMQVDKLEIEAAALRAQQQQQTDFLNSQAVGTPDEIESRIKQLSKSIAARSQALQMLQSGAAGQTTGFANRLEALARRHVDGLWIDAIILSGANGSMSLAGATLDPDIVPRYLENLAQDSVLAGTRFDEFLIERPAPESQLARREGEEESVSPPKKPVQKHVRFRAGTRALAPLEAEAAT